MRQTEIQLSITGLFVKNLTKNIRIKFCPTEPLKGIIIDLEVSVTPNSLTLGLTVHQQSFNLAFFFVSIFLHVYFPKIQKCIF